MGPVIGAALGAWAGNAAVVVGAATSVGAGSVAGPVLGACCGVARTGWVVGATIACGTAARAVAATWA